MGRQRRPLCLELAGGLCKEQYVLGMVLRRLFYRSSVGAGCGDEQSEGSIVMARTAKHPCRYAGCSALVAAGQGSYCAEHKRACDEVTDSNRPSAARRGYGGNWRRLRLLKLAMNPLCEDCAQRGLVIAANEVDHIRRLADGGTNALGNLQSLCKPCHSRKTSAQQRGRGGKSLGLSLIHI